MIKIHSALKTAPLRSSDYVTGGTYLLDNLIRPAELHMELLPWSGSSRKLASLAGIRDVVPSCQTWSWFLLWTAADSLLIADSTLKLSAWLLLPSLKQWSSHHRFLANTPLTWWTKTSSQEKKKTVELLVHYEEQIVNKEAPHPKWNGTT